MAKGSGNQPNVSINTKAHQDFSGAAGHDGHLLMANGQGLSSAQSRTISMFEPITAILTILSCSSTHNNHCPFSASCWPFTTTSFLGAPVDTETLLSSRTDPLIATLSGPISSIVALAETCWRGTKTAKVPWRQ